MGVDLDSVLELDQNAGIVSSVSEHDRRMHHGMFYDEIL